MIVVPLPWQVLPLSQNRRENMHRLAVAKVKKLMLADAIRAIEAVAPEPVDRCVVVLNWRQPDRRGRDGDGAAPALKACLDALTKTGVIPDDSWRHVRHSGVTTHDPEPGLPGRFWLTVYPFDPAPCGGVSAFKEEF